MNIDEILRHARIRQSRMYPRLDKNEIDLIVKSITTELTRIVREAKPMVKKDDTMQFALDTYEAKLLEMLK